MNDQLFKDLFRALRNEVDARRYQAKEDGQGSEYDKWSAVTGHLDNAKKRMQGDV